MSGRKTQKDNQGQEFYGKTFQSNEEIYSQWKFKDKMIERRKNRQIINRKKRKRKY